MMLQQKRYYILSVFMLMLCITFPEPAQAFSVFDGNSVVECDPPGMGYTGKIVTCIKVALLPATYEFLAGVSTWIASWNVVWSAISLALVLFGSRMLMGESELKAKAFTLLWKIALVIFFSDNLGGFAPFIFAAMEELQEMMARGMHYQQYCPISHSAFQIFNSQIWITLDCLLQKLLGFGGSSNGAGVDNSQLPASLFAIFAALMFSGTFGIIVAFLGILVVVAILSMAFRVVYTFLLSYFFVAFMIILSPFLMPALLFEKSANIVMVWLKSLISGMLQPAMLVATMIIAIPLVDKVMFDPDNDSSFVNVLTQQEIMDSYRNESQKCSWKTPQQTGFYDNVDDGVENLMSPVAEILEGGTDACSMFDFANVDFSFTGFKHFEKLMMISTSLATILVVVMIVNALLSMMAGLTAQLAGGGWALSGTISQGSALEQKLQRSTMGARSTMLGAASKSGSPGNIMSAIPKALGNAAKG